MSAEIDLRVWLLLWLATATYTLVRHWRGGRGTGLLFTYVFSYGAIHWLAAALHVLPWYAGASIDYTLIGLRTSTIGLMAFAVGCELGTIGFRRIGVDVEDSDEQHPVSSRIVALYIAGGAVFYGVIAPIVGRLPTVSALASTGSSLIVVGLALASWNAWQRGNKPMTWFWLLASGAFPLVTVAAQGFLGFGFAAMMVVATFVAAFYKPRWQVVVAATLVAYVGLSVYVTYMRDRRDIRAVVWGGEVVGSRMERLWETFIATEWFDLGNVDHLRRIDERLDQNELVGRAVDYIDTGLVPLAHGDTMIEAVMALIPRAIWPDKPIVAGSGDLVSTYTGLTFARDTSVGIGHVMEWYVNFALPGVIAGFVLLGAVIVYVDRSAAAWLRRGDAGRFSMWFMPGMSLLYLGGSFGEMTATAAASFVLIWAVRRLTNRWEWPSPHSMDDVVEEHS